MSEPVQKQTGKYPAVTFVAGLLALFVYVVVWLPWREGQQPVSEAEHAILGEQLESTNERLQDMMSERLSTTQLAEERERQSSDLGQELSLRCLQWTDLNDSQPTENTAKYQEWACKRYNHYVTTGELLDDLPQPEKLF